MHIVPNDEDEYHAGNLESNTGLEVGRRGIEYSTRHEDREVERGEVVVQEELTRH